MRFGLYISLIIALLAASCGEYEKILKSTDYELKRAKALEYFEEGRYIRATELLTQVLPRYRATGEAEELTWVSAQCYYNVRDYMTAGAAYKNFYEGYPYNEHAEEAAFMTAYCDYLMAPRPELDQSYTLAAIEGFEYFKRRFPASEKIDEANSIIASCEDKLVEKSYLSAKLYFDMKRYRAAIVALQNSIKEYPETKFREELLFLKLESTYQFAQRSVPEKKRERYQDTLDEYYSYIEEFPDTQFEREVDRIHRATAAYLNVEITN
jgi:outer membrane protein assembly factor BamD